MNLSSGLSLLLVFVSILLGRADPGPAKPFVSPMFADNMVLQRDRKDPIWGWAKPGEDVMVKIGEQTASTVANADGLWRVDLQAPPTGGPYELVVSGSQEIHFKNVMVGDVWICAGQSNMTLGVKLVNKGPDEIAAANHPDLRLFDRDGALRLEPSDQLQGAHWGVCTPDTISIEGMGFSATGYFFGRDLQADIKIPVGLIHCSWGGTPIEGWTSESALKAATSDFSDVLAKIDDAREKLKAGTYTDEQAKEDWYKAAGSTNEIGNLDFDDSGWKKINLPASQDANSPAKMPEGTGLVSFRKVVDLPLDAAGKSGKLNFGFVKYHDEARINGQFVGFSIGNGGRGYGFGPGILKAGKNVITVRTFDLGGNAGLYGEPDQMTLEISGQPTIPLAGEWTYQVGPNLRGVAAPYPLNLVDNSGLPAELFNGMVNPMIPFAIRGVIWYQGENNAGRAFQYRTLLPAMIADWRARWAEGNFPFLVVQLANFNPPPQEPGDSDWAELREAQWLTTQKVPNTGLATAVDIGDPNDIHPKNKQEIGRRLALVARAQVYREKIESSGPVYQSMTVDGNQIRIKFAHSDGLKTADSTTPNAGSPGDVPTPSPLPVKGFSIAGDDHKWVWADAKIDNEDVLVSSAQVPVPTMARYSWANGPTGNLYNRAGLPALPFRTDDLPPSTLKNK